MPRLLIDKRFVALALLMAASAGTLRAQPPKPRVDWLFPAGGKAGTSVAVEISGADLEGLSRLIVSDERLKPARSQDGKWTIAIDPAIPPGTFELRGVGAWGVSNPVPFVVGTLAEAVETEPNDQAPQELKWPVTVNGRIQAAADVDRFRIAGTKGQRVAIDLKAEAFDSPLDGAIRVFGPRGNQVAEAQDGYDYDPRLDLVFPEDGVYRIEVYDAVYGGSPAHRYRLAIHSGPVVDAIDPAAVDAAKGGPMRFLGRGLGQQAGSASDFAPIGGLAELALTLPVDSIALDAGKNRLGGFSYDNDPFPRWAALGPGLNIVDPVPVRMARAPVFSDAEPNDSAQSAQSIKAPSDLTGFVGKPGDVDWYAFEADKGESLAIEVEAQRLRSMAHLQLAVQRVMPDGNMQQAGTSFESPENPFGPQFEKATRDPKLAFTAPEKGTYRIRLAHVNAREGDARYGYRLIVRRPSPDFRILAMTTDTGPAGTACFRGGRCVVAVLLDRIDGFDATVRIEAVDVPAGVTAWPVVFGPGVRKREMVLDVSPDAQPGEFRLKLVGKTRWSDDKASVDWVPGQAPETAVANAAESLGGYLVRPLVGQPNQQRGVSRYSADFWMAIRETPIPFRLEPQPMRLFAKRGQTVDMPIEAVRQHGFDAPIALRLDNLPTQMEAVTGEVPKGKADATLKLKIGANVPLGRHTVHVNGTAQFGFAKDPAAKEKPAIGWNLPSRPVTLIVTP